VILIPTDRSFVVGVTASLLDEGEGLKAWAEQYVRKDPDLRWVLGNYVEADAANDNGHIFPRGDLRAAQDTLAGKPLNMMHREHYIVGYFAGAQYHTADGQVIASDETPEAPSWGDRPYIEALAGMWHNRFPEEFFAIRKAHAEGTLFFSMEAVPETVSCPTCNHASAFAGSTSDQYCEHMNGALGPKRLHKPTFSGGAIVIPPTRPGWQRADIKEISKLMDPSTVESVQAQAAAEAPHLGATKWEALMAHLLKAASAAQSSAFSVQTGGSANINPAKTAWTIAREVPVEERNKLAEKKKAMPDGSSPIANVNDLKNAIRSVGRAKNPAGAKAHIKRLAKELGREDLIPPNW
jgi:hypothetical protein